jgi:DNA polymerase-3 subunit epsilon
MDKILFFDLETTGLDFRLNAIHQLSGAVVINGVIKERFNFNIRPFEGAVVAKEALDIAGVTEEEIMMYPEGKEVYRAFIDMLNKYCDRYDKRDKFHLAGYNIAAFDNQFLRQFFTLNNDKYFGSWFWPDCLDCYVLASNKLRKERNQLENFKQGTVAKYLGITVDEEKLHDAEYDIDICMEIFKIVNL